ncbi:hypothetical protein DH2020_044400 [Rehmannia glutinosa]|uniref:Uncharacterized protein n=1 Tax=Rehmannia glutinosa TaxID=99300 RepID=A0ABR0UI82_REHGL
MAFAISTPTSLLHSSFSSYNARKPSLFLFSNSTVSIPKYPISQHVRGIYQLGFAHFSQWSGLKQLGISISQYSVKMERKRKCKGQGVIASLFGVGAPEALVIGVVALLVFGPKGLAEEVSREFKSTLEKEIGLDEINNPVPKRFISNNPMPAKPVDTPEDLEAYVEPNKSLEDGNSSGRGSNSGNFVHGNFGCGNRGNFRGFCGR